MAPIPFPDINTTAGRGKGMAASSPVVGNASDTAHIQQDSPSTHQAPCTSTPNTEHDILGQMGNIV